MKRIKVLILTGAMNMGGLENQLMHLLRNADKEKFQIDFTTTVDHPYYEQEIYALGGRCIYLQGTDGIHFLRYCRELFAILKEGQYDIVHSHELFHSGMVLLTARLAGVKNRFVHAHNWAEGDSLSEKKSVKRKLYNRVMQLLILRNATQFLACSSLAGEFLYGKKVTDKENYHIIFNSVDTKKFLDHYEEKEHGEFCDDGWINVLQVGRFSVVKNQLFSVEIAKEYKRMNKKIRILCVGNNGNEYEEKVRNSIQENDIQDYMKLLGTRSDVDVLMRKAAVFILPSQYEGMPLVLIEAQASGLPCVVADTFSHEVDFGIGTVRWLPITENAQAWANAVEEAARSKRAKKSGVADAIQKKGFDSENFARTLCKLYESACYERE